METKTLEEKVDAILSESDLTPIPRRAYRDKIQDISYGIEKHLKSMEKAGLWRKSDVKIIRGKMKKWVNDYASIMTSLNRMTI